MSLIYEPKGRAREYAKLALNIYKGCNHGCLYCFVPNATVTTREEFIKIGNRLGDFLERVKREAAALPTDHEPILLCFSTDPYPKMPNEFTLLTRRVIEVLTRYGHSFQVLTKGGRRALRDIDLYGPGDLFATTLTLLDPAHSATWEPNAAPPAERMEALETAKSLGVSTWVSLEPVLNPASALEIIRRTHEYVDLYKVGKLNYQSKADPRANALVNRINWAQFAEDAVNLLQSLGKMYYLKDDLRAEWRKAQPGEGG
jgi:DNA repair photolyase